MIYQIYRLTSNSIIILAIYLAMLRLCPAKSRPSRIGFVLSSMLIYFILYTLPFLVGILRVPTTFWYMYLIAFVVFLITSRIFFRGSTVIHMAYCIFMLCIVKTYSCVFALLYEANHNQPGNLFEIIDMGSFLVLLLVIYLISRFFQKYPLTPLTEMKKTTILSFFYCPLSFFVVLHLTEPHLHIPSAVFTSIDAVILIVNIPIIYYFYGRFLKESREKSHLNQSLAQTQAQLMHYRYNMILEERLSQERHEFKNRYFYVQTLLKQEKYEEAEKYLSDVIDNNLDIKSNLVSGNAMIDYIMNSKISEAEKLNIPLSAHAVIPKDTFFNETALCTILLNLIDNAIEASQAENQPDITVAIQCIHNYLMVKIRNFVSHDVLTVNPALKTTKKGSKGHGFGVKIVRKTIEQENGIFDTYMENSYFVATVMIPLHQKN